MRSPNNKFQYELTDVLGTVLVDPLGESGLKRDRTRTDENKLTYLDEVPGSLVFTGDTFTRLLSIEQSVDRCEPLYVQIRRNCGGSWEDFGPLRRFLLNDASWNLYRCQVEIKFDKYEAEDCLEQNKNKDINLMALIGSRYSANLFYTGATIEKITYQRTGFAGGFYWGGVGLPEDGAWKPYYNYNALISGTTGPYQSQETRWARLKITLPTVSGAPGAEWIAVGISGANTIWAKPVILYDKTETSTFFNGNVIRAYTTQWQIIGDTNSTIWGIDNGLKLADCLQAFADTFCVGLTVKSQFFQINPDTVTATNYVTGQPSKVRNILVFQKSDVKRPTVTGNASILSVNWEKFSTQLVETFNVRWRIQGSELRIEHVSWFPQNVGIDLTAPQYARYVIGEQEYNYKSQEIPGSEKFTFMESEKGSDFEGVPIIYEGGCVTQAGRENVINHAADFLTTDVELCMENSSPDSNVVGDEGMVFVACDTGFNILSEPPVLASLSKLNNTLAWAQLHRDYHKHYRLLKSGLMNNAATVFASVKPLRKGKALTIPFCCDDVFNPDDTVTTALGDGVVEKASFDFKSDTLTLELLYPVD